jgi:hypothetical protein
LLRIEPFFDEEDTYVAIREHDWTHEEIIAIPAIFGPSVEVVKIDRHYWTNEGGERLVIRTRLNPQAIEIILSQGEMQHVWLCGDCKPRYCRRPDCPNYTKPLEMGEYSD